MGNTERQYYCFQCGKPMTDLHTLPADEPSYLTDRFGCADCNFVQEKNHTMRRLSPSDYGLNYQQYKEALEKLGIAEK